jgi:hypothetical protein
MQASNVVQGFPVVNHSLISLIASQMAGVAKLRLLKARRCWPLLGMVIPGGDFTAFFSTLRRKLQRNRQGA